MFSLASIATMSACIFMFGLFFSLVWNFQHIVKEVESGVGVTVFFDDGISQEAIDEIGEKIKARSEVADIKYVSAEEAWESFSVDYFGDKPELAEGFIEDNPLVNSSNYEVYLTDVAEQSVLVDYILSIDGVNHVNESREVADILSGFNMLISYVSIAIIALLLAVSIFLISNTVTIGIAVRKEEIAIMKLIGAANGFVKAPFLIEGILIGLFGGIIPLTVLYFLYNKGITYVLKTFSVLNDILQFVHVNEVFRMLVPVGLALSVGIGFLGSFITIRKHLKV